MLNPAVNSVHLYKSRSQSRREKREGLGFRRRPRMGGGVGLGGGEGGKGGGRGGQ